MANSLHDCIRRQRESLWDGHQWWPQRPLLLWLRGGVGDHAIVVSLNRKGAIARALFLHSEVPRSATCRPGWRAE